MRIKLTVTRFATTIVRGYQLGISPLLGNHCRFYPSCSQYTIDAIERHGLVKGGLLATKRIARCHPGNPGGVDEVPSQPCDHTPQQSS